MMMLLVTFAIPVTSVAVMQAAMEQDERVKFDDVMLTYPLTKREVVLARFIDNLLYIGINAAISMLAVLACVYIGKITDIQRGLLFWVIGIVVSLFTTAIFSVGFYLLGNKKGTIMYIVLVVIGAVGYSVIRFSIPVEKVLAAGPWKLTGIGFVISLLLQAASYWACVKIYTRQHS